VGGQLGRLGPLTDRRSSVMPDLLVRDGREPSRWGSRGTYVSQYHADRCSGVGASTTVVQW
jgi:hypothetical protein